MSGFSPFLPLTLDPGDPGYRLNKTMLDVIKQNFKNLVLTAPGERVMIPDFGVGIRNYLFEQNSASTFNNIRSRLSSQTDKYMPFISIRNVQFINPEEQKNDIGNGVQIVINYEIIPLAISDILTVEI
jgi:phage baseplate assembly protein W